MRRYVALLRGIAPSGTNMTNDKLRGVFEELGFAAVGSVLASGNITFHSGEADVPWLEQRIEEALVSGLGVASRTIIREYADLRARAVLAVTDNRIPGGGSSFMSWLEKSCGKDITTRSWLTVQRVLSKLGN